MNSSERPVIRLEEVTKVFLTEEVETHALSEVGLTIDPGEYVCVAGPSGCGKSTLLSIIGLLDSPTKGNYWLNGEPVPALKQSERVRIRNRELGFIFQNFNLIGDLTVFQNVELPLTYRGMRDSRAQGAGSGVVGKSRDGASSQTFSQPTLRRRATARRCGSCHRGPSPCLIGR